VFSRATPVAGCNAWRVFPEETAFELFGFLARQVLLRKVAALAPQEVPA